MKSHFRFLTLLSCASTLCLAPLASATPVEASMGFAVMADFTAAGGTNNVAYDTAGWSGIPAALNVGTAVTNVAPNGSTARTFASGSSTWAPDGNSGTVTIDYGWSTNMHDITGGVSANASVDPLYSYNWSYTFVADQTGLFVMNADVVGTGSTDDPSIAYPMFGLMGFDIIGNDFFPLGANFFDPTASGQITQMLQAGNTYTMVLRNGSNVVGSLGQRDAELHAEFNWSLPGAQSYNSVPDAGATGFLLAGGLSALLYFRRRISAA